jgi:hypothetical protein
VAMLHLTMGTALELLTRAMPTARILQAAVEEEEGAQATTRVVAMVELAVAVKTMTEARRSPNRVNRACGYSADEDGSGPGAAKGAVSSREASGRRGTQALPP